MIECEECGDPCPENAKSCPWSGLMLCGGCSYDEGIEAEDRHLDAPHSEGGGT